ncbi:MAG: hypothetical protein IKW58_01025 [Alphaproteobacteria bacterium]|nr:hypothetical protein [Alphaproteobacteria bacterium]
MRKKNIKTTLEWSLNCSKLFNSWGKGASKQAKNFNQFLFHHPLSIGKGKMYDFASNLADKCAQSNISEKVFQMEDKTMFDASTPFIDVVLRHIKAIEQGGEVKAHWCYLDTEKKAVVHFINKLGWYAEVYVLSDTEASYLHLFEDDMGHKVLIPVLFTKDIKKMKEKAAVEGGRFLHDYLPRTTVEFLGKNTSSGFKNKSANLSSQKVARPRSKDNKDML